MVSRDDYNHLHGWLFVDKPIGITSFKVVSLIKKQLRGVKIGHGGTLDPLATGILPIAINEATKTTNFVLNSNKTYEFTLQFGNNTDTLDSEGDITESKDYFPSKNEVENCLINFMGEIEQVPPKYSAIKINGKRAYDLARAKVDFEIKPRRVKIFTLKLLEYNNKLKQISLEAKVSKGTYIRVLGQDIINALNSCGHTCGLRRTSFDINKKILLISGNMLYNIGNHISQWLLSIEDMLDDISAYLLNEEEAKLLLNGNVTTIKPVENLKNGVVKAMYNDKLIALLDYNGENYKVLRVFNNNRVYINKI